VQNFRNFDLAPSEQSGSPGTSYASTNELVDFKKEEIEQSIPDRFELQVNRYPNHLAVKSENFRLTYDELNGVANRVARTVLAQRGPGEEPIALLFEHDVPVIIAILGTLKAGKAYVGLNPSHPQDRLAYMLEDLEAGLLITNNKNFALASEVAHNKCQLLNIDDLDHTNISDQNLGLSMSPDTLASIIYTSGSTGRPKGVMRNHRSILQRIWYDTNDYPISAKDCLSMLYSFSFGTSKTDIFGAMLNGATLVPYDFRKLGPNPLANWLIKEEITFLHPPIMLFRQFMDTLTEGENFPKLRMIALSGQPLYKRDVERFRRYFSRDCLMIHRMGSSETAGVGCLHINRETVITNDIIPIGYALEGREILILNDIGQPVGFNQAGEIAIRSRYLAPGYWQKPDLTEAKFLADPEGGDQRIYLTGDLGRLSPDGCLEHLGRKDFQVKIRGYRVELREIEAILYSLDIVKESVVVAYEDQSGDKRLVAYIVPSGQPSSIITTLRSVLTEKLPDYMVPSSFIILDEMPLTTTGKVNRLALPMPERVRPELAEAFVAPQTPTEKTLAGIWSEVLHIEPIGIHDNFFELGGQSLLAAQVISRILNTFQVSLSLQTLFEAPIIAGLAVLITQSQTDVVEDEELANLLDELEQLSEEEVQRLLAQA